ncbi:hypothetical protein QJS04_geneDACA019095 [Acorus gramineus]|uniref:Reverse transcriptase zinc-binding domain-containing protein n=1 Tax=Acorus gramineus TaxID=55184 RepID=A0AAV9A9E2_ACOGR|nr:hypothetical protein QJS04_geneDACA019095 [Acorus gramineus]
MDWKKYLRRGNIWATSPSTSSSVIWRKILKAGDWIRHRTRYVIFNGESIHLWHDPWLQGRSLQYYYNGASLCWGPPNSTMLSTLIVDGKWQKPFRWPADLNHLWEEILVIEVGGEGPDILIWSGANSGNISYNSAWHQVQTKSEALSWTKELWNPIQPPRMSFLCWEAALNKLPTLHRLKKWSQIQSDLCPLCGLEAETTDHLFLHCSYSDFVWASVINIMGANWVRQQSVVAHISWLFWH